MKFVTSCLLLSTLVSLSSLADARTPPLTRPPGTPVTGFGAAVAVTDNEIFVGRPGEMGVFPMPPSRIGGVHIFRRGDTGMWEEHASVGGTDVQIGDGFGHALVVDGNILLVSAPKQNEARGAVYVFERQNGTWTERARLVAAQAAAGDSLGFAIALEAGTAFIGAPGRAAGRGAVLVFRRGANGTWAEVATLEHSASQLGDRFGAAVSLTRERLVVGAPGQNPAPALVGPPPSFRPGAAVVYRETGGQWTEETTLTPSSAGFMAFGTALDIMGSDILVAAPIANRGVGAVYQFQLDSGTGMWRQTAVITPTTPQPGTLFGAALARAGTDLFISAPVAGGLAGTVYVFRPNTSAGTWDESQQLQVKAMGFGAFFGSSIAASADLTVIGAPGADFFEGSGYVFARDPETRAWSDRGLIVDAASGLDPIVGEQRECVDGTIFGFACSDVDLVSFLPTHALGAKRGIMVNDLWGWTDPTTGKEYAIVGRFDGTTFVDVSDPANPIYLGELLLTDGSTPNLWRDMKVYANHVFIVADNAGAHGVQIFDLTQLRTVAGSPVTFSESAHYNGIHSAHNIVINEETGFAYVVGSSAGGETCGGGLHMIDVRDPKNPVFAGCFADTSTGNAGTGYSHDAQCVSYIGPDLDHRGKEICFGANETALSIADVTDKANPVALSRASYPNVGYAHQGWVSDDQRFFFSNDELDEIAGTVSKTRTLIWDIEDLDDPVLAKEYFAPVSATDHNLYVRGRYMYQSNYVSGLRVIDVSDPTDPREVAFFDTVPFGEDSPGFAGSWSNYPFFASGNIIVSSMKEGLFILRYREMRPIP